MTEEEMNKTYERPENDLSSSWGISVCFGMEKKKEKGKERAIPESLPRNNHHIIISFVLLLSPTTTGA
jgi:hypothetical protein